MNPLTVEFDPGSLDRALAGPACCFSPPRVIPVSRMGMVERFPMNVLGLQWQMQAHGVDKIR